ncbi:hypothetical protein E1180_01290 [Roseibium denhamense]|uniref:Phosphotransferase enzyme family protein n=1 Tax=Roseibium denhamense TaxID=76305 RepID=A0ABY1NEA9_9HYPH|nr:phosphotransferase [Roseibium denhamense]MTI04151.1 hypothetical protein [Roseibium denhamense]SMP07590.1 Phosphotransferase enzyme family protein [Roseibium denhamense]
MDHKTGDRTPMSSLGLGANGLNGDVEAFQNCRAILKDTPALREIAGCPLAARSLPGFTNSVYELRSDAGHFVLRVPWLETPMAVDREAEWHDVTVAADAGIALRPVWGDPGTGLMLMPLGQPVPDFMPERVGEKVATLHRSGIVFQRERPIVPYLLDAEKDLDGRDDLLAFSCGLARQAAILLQAMPQQPYVPNHFDLTVANMVEDGAGLKLIDFEYAAMAPAYWDLAYAILENELSGPEEKAFLSAYEKAGGITPDPDHLSVYKVACDVVSMLWALGQIARGREAADFMPLARERKARAVANLEDLKN